MAINYLTNRFWGAVLHLYPSDLSCLTVFYLNTYFISKQSHEESSWLESIKDVANQVSIAGPQRKTTAVVLNRTLWLHCQELYFLEEPLQIKDF